MEEELLQPANSSTKIGMTANKDNAFVWADNFKIGSSENLGCVWIIRASWAMDERHMTGARIGKIAYMPVGNLVSTLHDDQPGTYQVNLGF